MKFLSHSVDLDIVKIQESAEKEEELPPIEEQNDTFESKLLNSISKSRSYYQHSKIDGTKKAL